MKSKEGLEGKYGQVGREAERHGVLGSGELWGSVCQRELGG